MRKRNQKKPVVISRAVAIRRMDAMAGLIERNITSAIHIEAALEAANTLIGENQPNVIEGAGCYNYGVKFGLLLTLAMTVARLFDKGTLAKPINKRHVASVPLLARLLKQRRCRTALIERARRWTPHIQELEAANVRACEEAIDSALRFFGTCGVPVPGGKPSNG